MKRNNSVVYLPIAIAKGKIKNTGIHSRDRMMEDPNKNIKIDPHTEHNVMMVEYDTSYTVPYTRTPNGQFDDFKHKAWYCRMASDEVLACKGNSPKI